MKIYIALTVVAATLMPVAAAPVFAQAQSNSPAPTGQNGLVEGGRSLHVLVAQSEVKSDINPSNIVVATGGGLLGGLIGAAVDSARAKKAEELIAPVRTALAGFDTDGLALDTAKAGFANAAWFQANPNAAFGKDTSPLGKSALLDASTTTQTAFVEYSYDLTPEFDAVRVVSKIDVANKTIPASAKGKGEKRLSYKNIVYSTIVTSVVQLPSPAKEKETNAARWSADSGALARAAITKGFEQIKLLTPRTLALTPVEAKALNDKANKRIVAGGFVGRPQPSDAGTTLLWNGNYIHVQTLP